MSEQRRTSTHTARTTRRRAAAVMAVVVGAASLASAPSVVAQSPAQAGPRPNVVIVITDDQGYGDLSCHGNPVLKTPHLDGLHADSVRLTDYHVAPTCSPTRAALMTGRWSNRTGVWHTILGRSILRQGERTFAEVFRDAGYATGMFGKWHLGDNYPARPADLGFTETFHHGGGGVGQTPDFWDNAYFDGTYWHNGEPEEVTGFCTDVFFDRAKSFIGGAAAEGKPFLAYIATNAPHGPMHAPEAASAPYAEHGVAVANFFGMIANIDDNVGSLRGFLDERGLAENTIFVFTTDNGTAAGAKIFNSGMRGNKGSEYDGGHRVPFFVHWPAAGIDGGRDLDGLAAHVDVFPTLVGLCGLERPAWADFDGVSLAPQLLGASQDWPDRIVITDSQRLKHPRKWKQSAVMAGSWRLVNGKELYDIRDDPGQRNDLASSHADVVDRLRSAYESWWADLEPTFADTVRIHLGHDAENPARLTAHDWIADKATPWNQASIRNALNQPDSTGHWAVHLTQAGTYTFTLRRWPAEATTAIDAPLPPGDPVPGSRAFRTTPGVAISPTTATVTIGDQRAETNVPPGAQAVDLTLELDPGDTELDARFTTNDGTTYGAYYVEVTRGR